MHGLVALMEIQASRSGARTDPAGEPILLLDQDRARWDQLLIRRGLAALERAERLGGGLGPVRAPGGHRGLPRAGRDRRRRPTGSGWPPCTTRSPQVAPSPIVELNRAVAVGMAFGPAAGLAVIDPLVGDPALKGYHLLPAVRGDLLAKLGRGDEAAAEFRRAAELTRNERERRLLLERAGDVALG